MPESITKTLNLKIKPRSIAQLAAVAVEVNQVFNIINATTAKQWQDNEKWMSAFDVNYWMKGASRHYKHIGQSCIQAVAQQHASNRNTKTPNSKKAIAAGAPAKCKKSELRYRSANSKKTLPWIPFKTPDIKYIGAGRVQLPNDLIIAVFDSYGLHQYELGAGCIYADARGDWYISISTKVKKQPNQSGQPIGIDGGLKTAAVCSDGDQLNGHHYRDVQDQIATADSRGKKKQSKRLHRKVRLRRNDEYHKWTSALVKRASAIYFGNVSVKFLTSVSGKSTHDVSLATIKSMLKYKSQLADIEYKEVNEAYSTKTCHACGSRSGPTGKAQLCVRDWTCDACGMHHDRDVNAAINILISGMGNIPPMSGTNQKSILESP